MARLGHSTPAAAMRCEHAAQGRAEAVAGALSRIALGTDCDTGPVVEMTVLVMHPMRVRQRPVPICWYPDIMPRADRVSLTPEGVNMPPVEHLSNKGMYNVVLDRHLSGLPAKSSAKGSPVALFILFALLTDKALKEYEASRFELLDHWSRGGLQIGAYLRAVDHIENCIGATHRAVLAAKGLRGLNIGRGAPRLTELQEQRLAHFRHAFEHADERVQGTTPRTESNRPGHISRLRRREKTTRRPGRSGLKTSAPRRRPQTQEVSDLPALAFGRLRRAVPLGQGVGGRVDAASPVLRNGRHVGGALPCVDPETGIVDQLGKSVD